MEKPNQVVLTAQELLTIEQAAMRKKAKDGAIAPRVIRALLDHVTKVYGIDPGFITQEMKDEEDKRKLKEDRYEAKLRRGLGRKSLRNSADDF